MLGEYETIVNGPVPIISRLGSCVCAHFWLRMAEPTTNGLPRFSRKPASGCLSLKRTRWLSSFVTASSDLKRSFAYGRPFSVSRWNENTTSSATSGEPSANFTPSRRLNS